MIENIIIAMLDKINFISEEDALDKSLVGLRIYDRPIVGYADVNDELFQTFKNDDMITNSRFMPPNEWLKESLTVVSIFFPYSDRVKFGNSLDMKLPSNEWLHGRYEGQKIIDEIGFELDAEIKKNGFLCVVPSLDERYKSTIGTWTDKDITLLNNTDYGSNWSERHVAFACGLGTFGLSKGIITEKGIAGRFLSLITDMNIQPTERKYSQIYEYCTLCGQCIDNCPVNAISFIEGKDHTPCSQFLDYTSDRFEPRYGCGKCQVMVECSSNIPTKQ